MRSEAENQNNTRSIPTIIHGIDFKEMEGFIKKGLPAISSALGKKVFLFLGKAGAGKSTTITSLFWRNYSLNKVSVKVG